MSARRLSPLANNSVTSPIASSKNLKLPMHELESIDARLKRLKENVLPFYPFLLKVQTDVPFRLGGRLTNNWAVGGEGPFTLEEEQLQYMTFLTHYEGDSLLIAAGDWLDEVVDGTMDQQPGLRGAADILPVSSSGSTKKRISLSDYRNKRKNSTPDLQGSEDSGSLKAPTPHRIDTKERCKANSVESDGSITRRLGCRLGQSSHPEAPVSFGRKYPHASERERSDSLEERHSETPIKRRRLSPEGTRKRDFVYPQPNKLPELLSPTLPPTSDSLCLPRLLSPTLPPDIERELASFSAKSPDLNPLQAKDASAPAQSHVANPKSPIQSSPPLAPTCDSSGSQGLRGKNPGAAYRDQSIGLDGANDTPPSTLKATVPSQSTNISNQPGSHSPGASSKATKQHHHPQGKPQYILKLKYGKPNRKRVEGLLKFSGKRTTQPQIPSKERGSQNVLRSKKGGNSATLKDREDSEQRRKEHSKEVKTQALEKPRPLASGHQTLAEEPAEFSKLLGESVRKPASETHWTKAGGTGGRLSASQNMKLSMEQGPVEKRSQSHPSGQGRRSQDIDRRAWKEEFHRFSSLGRELKHAAQRERQTARDGKAVASNKCAAATAIEAILCFILAFVADDQSRMLARQTGESSNWLSILAYWRVVRSNSSPYPVLHSLCHILGAVSYDAIHALDLERLAKSPLPGECVAGEAQGGDGDTVSEESERAVREFLELKGRLLECYRESQRLWLEGSRGLSEDILVSEFPSTWSKRSKNYSERGKRQIKVGDYSGGFFLPLEQTSGPVEVVRFGRSILTEWCAKEDVDWKGRLEL